MISTDEIAPLVRLARHAARIVAVDFLEPDDVGSEPWNPPCQGPAKTFRLVVGKVDLPGRWICVGRKFILLGEAAEGL